MYINKGVGGGKRRHAYMIKGVSVCYIDQDTGKSYAKSDAEAGVDDN
jgi:hypothetical protein